MKWIDQLLAGLKAVKVRIEHGGQQLTVQPPQIVDVRVRARQTWKVQEFIIRVRWPRPAETQDAEKPEVNGS